LPFAHHLNNYCVLHLYLTRIFMRRLWLVFAQAVTVLLAFMFVVATLRPEWLPSKLAAQKASPPQLASAPSPAEPATAQQSNKASAVGSYSDAARKAIPSVVNIFTSKAAAKLPQNHPYLNDPVFRRFFGEQFGGGNNGQGKQQNASLGSGVIVGSQGLVLTNHHVIEAADNIEVLLSDGRRTKAKLVGSDPETDLAVLQTELQGLPAMPFGSSDNAKVGDVVLAIGNPFGVGQTVTMGIVSALGRNQLGINTFENFIQTDAAINPGNSGGALVDNDGRLLGINTAIYSRSGGSLGIGFAIPVSTVRNVMDQITKGGSVVRGYIGVEPQDVTPELAEAFKLARKDGAIIAGVMNNGPAAKAGVKTGDILISVDGKTVTNTATMLNIISQLAPQSKVPFTFVRDGANVDLNITIGTRPKPPAQSNRQPE
jgi:serine protease DegQ